MELNIGTNIKRLRQAKGITQERLAELLSVSTAAVSKWEARNTYPDITLLYPLASIFGVSVDELIGYDEEKEKQDIERILSEYGKYSLSGEIQKRDRLIRDARKRYPHDYRIMDLYLWELAGGRANNDPSALFRNADELAGICDCMLDGCTRDDLRADAITVKAKLLHAQGKTDEAMQLLSTLPAWQKPIAIEQLFAKDTPEYRYWNRRNCYGMLDVFAIKYARMIRYDPALSQSEKRARLESTATFFAGVSKEPQTAFFCIAEVSIRAALAEMLVAENAEEKDVIFAYEEEFAAMRKMTALAETDDVLKESIASTYKTASPVDYLIGRLSTSDYPPLVKLRENPAFIQMIEQNKQ